jgi:dTDP-4-amino-4,6-dideoxygalactose transaminase
MVKLAIFGGPPAIRAADHVRWPMLGAEERAAVLRVLERGVLSGPFAPEIRALEREWAAYVGARYCLATNSGTSALHLALTAAGIGPGDHVIVPAFTFVATGLAVLHAGAVPVFVDIEPNTLGLDPALVERAITPHTRAVMPVHMHGTPCAIDAISEICQRRGLVLLEDAAQAHGATHRGRKVGTFGSLGGFSVQSSKSMPAGEGGLVVTDDEDLYARANRARMFGEDMRAEDEAGYRIERALDGNRAYDSIEMGWMYRTTELTAAIARAQLRKLDELNLAARRNAAALSARLARLPGVLPPIVGDGDESCFHKYRVRIDPKARGIDAPPLRVRDAVRAALAAEGVEAVLWQTKPVPAQGLFRDRKGFGGRSFPWDHAAPVDYDLAQFPETTSLLDSSLVLFSHTCPIAAQPPALVDAYADAFERVWERLPEVVAGAG